MTALNSNNEVAHLVRVLETSSDGGEKVDAVCRLASWGTAEAATALARALQKEEDPLVREAVIGALLVCDTRAVIAEMVTLLRSEEASSRSAAFEVLAYKCDDKVLEIFEELLKDDDRDVRVMTVHALGRSRCSRSAELFRGVIREDSDINVVAAAVEYLGEMGGPPDAVLIQEALEKFQHPYLEWTARRALERLAGDNRGLTWAAS